MCQNYGAQRFRRSMRSAAATSRGLRRSISRISIARLQPTELKHACRSWTRNVAYAFALPERSRNGDGCTKRVLRLAMEGLIPDSIRLRTRKTAFTVPLDRWARGALKPWLLDLCASRTFLDSDVWRGPAVRQSVERAVAGEISLYPVWPILQCYALERAFVARAGEAVVPIPEKEMAAP